MSSFTIYHNPRCSKSRQTLALLNERGIEPEIIEYLKWPLSFDDLKSLQQKLDVPAVAMIRSKEQAFENLGLNAAPQSRDALLKAIAVQPILLERPIVVGGNQAVIGRPPENVMELL